MFKTKKYGLMTVLVWSVLNLGVLASPQVLAVTVTTTSLSPTTLYPSVNKTEVVVNDRVTASFTGLGGYTNITVIDLDIALAGVNVAGTRTASSGTTYFVPASLLLYNTTYTAVVKASMLQSSTGNTVIATYSWKFTTINPNADWILLFNDFNSLTPRLYTEQDLRDSWNLKGTPVGLQENRVSIIAGSTGNKSNAMRIRYPAFTRGLENGGVQWRSRLAKRDDLYVSYWVKFGPGFDFVRGGKLPGLAGGTANTGGSTNQNAIPNGYDGWSARMMWRPQGYAVQYVYHPDQPNTTGGQDFRWDLNGQRYFTPGQWHKVETRIKMNTPGVRNGIVQAWFDGVLALDRRNVRFRDISTLGIDQFLFCTIFGGSDATWATTKEEFSYFDNFIVSTRPITH